MYKELIHLNVEKGKSVILCNFFFLRVPKILKVESSPAKTEYKKKPVWHVHSRRSNVGWVGENPCAWE